MKLRMLPFGARDPRVPYVWVLAPLIVLVLVAVIAWTSPWNTPEGGQAAGIEGTQEPSAETTAGTPAGEKVSKKVTTAEGGSTQTPVNAKLERSLRRFKAAQRRLASPGRQGR